MITKHLFFIIIFLNGSLTIRLIIVRSGVQVSPEPPDIFLPHVIIELFFINCPTGAFCGAICSVSIVSGQSDGQNIKGAGFSIITAQAATGPGTSIEVFLAETREYEHMGGILVPLARLFKVSLTNPEADLLSTGRAPDDAAIDTMVTQFEQFMFKIIRGKMLRGMVQQQTLSIMQGLNQANDYGLQDPMYDLGK